MREVEKHPVFVSPACIPYIPYNLYFFFYFSFPIVIMIQWLQPPAGQVLGSCVSVGGTG